MEKILCRHEVTGHETELPNDTLPAWRALGWKPIAECETTAEPSGPPDSDASTSVPSVKPAARRRATETEE